MSELAIQVEGLGKQYRIGEAQARYKTLRESMVSGVTSPFRRMARMMRGEAYAGADLRGSIWALKDVSLEVQSGEVLGIIGRNGAGKTTLLKVLSKITEPTEGYADVWGRVGSLLEVGTGFHPELTGRENIYLNGAVLGMRKKDIETKFDEIVEFAEVERFLDTPVKHYSAGMQTRLAFSVAAYLEPEILLVDEVLAVGDLAFQKKCLGKMSEVSEGGRTVLFVSHQMNQIRRLCERCIWLSNGLVRMDGSMSDVVSAYESFSSALPLEEERWVEEDAQTAARFLSWEVAEPVAGKGNVISTLGPVVIKMVIRMNKPLSDGHHGIALWNADNQLIWAWSIDHLKMDRGIYELNYDLPGLPLKPGVYFWHVSLYEEGELLDQWNCHPELVIATEPMTHKLDKWMGVLNVPCEFSVRSKEERDG
jgi:homopolymeric O-antigen transport system ATP-binding protein